MNWEKITFQLIRYSAAGKPIKNTETAARNIHKMTTEAGVFSSSNDHTQEDGIQDQSD